MLRTWVSIVLEPAPVVANEHLKRAVGLGRLIQVQQRLDPLPVRVLVPTTARRLTRARVSRLRFRVEGS